MSLKGIIDGLNQELAHLVQEHKTSNMQDFIVFSNFMEKFSRLLVQAKIFAAIHDGSNMNQDYLIAKGILVHRDKLIFPTRNELLEVEKEASNFITATIAFSSIPKKDSQQFKGPNGDFLPHFKVALAMDKLKSRASSAPRTQPPPSTSTAATTQSAAASTSNPRDDEGVSFIKKTGFLLKQ